MRYAELEHVENAEAERAAENQVMGALFRVVADGEEGAVVEAAEVFEVGFAARFEWQQVVLALELSAVGLVEHMEVGEDVVDEAGRPVALQDEEGLGVLEDFRFAVLHGAAACAGLGAP